MFVVYSLLRAPGWETQPAPFMSPTKAGKEIGGKARFAGLSCLAQVLANSLLSEQLMRLPGN